MSPWTGSDMTRNFRKNKRKRRFTLIELMVALTLLLFVGLIVGSVSVTFYKAWNRSLKHSIALREYSAIDRVMDLAVRNLIPFHWPYRDDLNKSVLVFEGQPDSIHFTTLRRAYASGNGEGAFLFIRLRLEDGCLKAFYSFFPRLPDTEETDLEFTGEVLAEQVRSLSFLYAERNSAGVVEWVDTWEEEDHPSPPLAVQMTVEWEDGRIESWLRRTAGSGAYSTFGVHETGEVI